MAVYVKCTATGEEKKIENVILDGGMIVADRWTLKKGPRFLSNNPMLVRAGQNDDGADMFSLAEGWEVKQAVKAKALANPATSKGFKKWSELKKEFPAKIIFVSEGDFNTTYERDALDVEEICNVTALERSGHYVLSIQKGEMDGILEKLREEGREFCVQVKVHPEPITPEPEPQPQIDDEERERMRMEMMLKYGTMGAEIFEYASKLAPTATAPTPAQAEVNMDEVIKEIDIRCNELFNELGKMKRDVTIKVVTPSGATNQVHGAVCRDFQTFCNLVQAGKPLYMYGPAGCGKSYTARQIAEALGLDYYETSQAMFAHELKGYGDAAGNYVPTAFYRAFTGGGLFFLDEVDASAPEALVVLNNAIANKCFDFPVIGNVKAHENFRVIAAGNTRMTGATIEYTARQMQDSSFKNRFFFASCTYDRDVMLAITGNDAEIVDFGADLRRAARETGILQLFSYRQAADLATLQDCCGGDDAYLLRGSVIQEKELDDVRNLYEHLNNKNNRWAKAMNRLIGIMSNEEIGNNNN